MSKEIIFIGLGRMGLAMSTKLVEEGFTVYGYDNSAEVRSAAKKAGISAYDTLQNALGAIEGTKTVWLMVPSQYVDDVLAEVTPSLNAGDTVIDGGNSFFKDTLRRHDELAKRDIELVDCGTSGGVEGARHGASLMVGGNKTAVSAHALLFKALAIENGYGHVGGPGAGHFVKMVHNGIEYGMMGAIAEGVNILHEHADGLDISVEEVLKPYQNGSIIKSNLVGWLAEAYETPGYLEKIAGEVPRGETEMEMEYLIENESVKVLEAAVAQRKATRDKSSYIGTLISAMRNQFGGHKVIEKGEG